MRLYSCDPRLLRQRLRQTLSYFFRDDSINEKITNAVIETVADVLESKDDDVKRQIKIAEDGIRNIDCVQGFCEEEK